MQSNSSIRPFKVPKPNLLKRLSILPGALVNVPISSLANVPKCFHILEFFTNILNQTYRGRSRNFAGFPWILGPPAGIGIAARSSSIGDGGRMSFWRLSRTSLSTARYAATVLLGLSDDLC